MNLLLRVLPSFVLLGGLSSWGVGTAPCSARDAEEKEYPHVVVRCTNPSDLARKDAIIAVEIASLIRIDPRLGGGAIGVKEGGAAIPSQAEDTNGDGSPDLLLILADFQGHQNRTFEVSALNAPLQAEAFARRAQADLAVKVDYTLKDGFYTGGRFAGVTSARTPRGHKMHNAYFKYEGPGWESDRVGYRLYLDERNRCDIFGKKTREMVLHTVGVQDLVSDGQESYQSMQPWGRDMFKVGKSLGIGSPAMWYRNQPVAVEVTDSARCTITANGPLHAVVALRYSGWKVGKHSWDADARFSIGAGSRLTSVDLALRGPAAFLCTGLAKHAECTLLESETKPPQEWRYVALYGKQSLSGDNLGTAVFYRKSDLEKRAEDSVNVLVVLKPVRGNVQYSFAAAWELEADGVRTLEEFKAWCENETKLLSEPVIIRVGQRARP